MLISETLLISSSLFLIGIILLQLPSKEIGISSFGSSVSSQLRLKVTTGLAIFFYLFLAIELDLVGK
jgi:preprotein translocase subunit SecG